MGETTIIVAQKPILLKNVLNQSFSYISSQIGISVKSESTCGGHFAVKSERRVYRTSSSRGYKVFEKNNKKRMQSLSLQWLLDFFGDRMLQQFCKQRLELGFSELK